MFAPAIRKDGTNTQLIFETQNPSKPGTITAKTSKGSLSAGIGSIPTIVGRSNTGNMVFNSGNIIAECVGASGAGIGGNNNGGAGNVNITGGIVNATSPDFGGCGIGSGRNSSSKSVINISGGKVTATGSGTGFGIGNDKEGYWGGKSDITITGGTVTASNNSKSGGDIGTKGTSSICIIGGSVKATKISGTPVNQKGTKVLRTDTTLSDAKNDTKIASAVISNTDPAYGMNDIYTMDTGKLYLWLPTSSVVTRADADDNMPYTGSVTGGTAGTLYHGSKITLKANGGSANGGAIAIYKSNELASYASVGSKTGYHLAGYRADNNALVIDATGKLAAGAATYTDGDRKWINSTSAVTLNAEWTANTYSVKFDRNEPDNASHEVEGSMAEQDFTYDQEKLLSYNAYSLAGWSFKEWNTKKDGTGTAYTDNAAVKNLTDKNGGTVTLYAQWTPLLYDVPLMPGEGNGMGLSQKMKYDTPSKLPTIASLGYSKENASFMGWSTLALGHFYSDGAVVCNLCTLDANGVPQGNTLTAQWHTSDIALVTVISNETLSPLEPLDTGVNSNCLLLSSGSTFFQMSSEQTVPGYYSITNIPEGSYEMVPALNSGGSVSNETHTNRFINVQNGKFSTASLDYGTVSIRFEDGFESYGKVWVEDEISGKTSRSVLRRDKIKIGTKITKEGYKFEAYTAMLHQPSWENGDDTLAQQTVTTTGQTTIEAHPVPIMYTGTFKANASDATGTMKTQDFVYDEPQDLFKCEYSRDGYTFGGWTTTPEWTGKKTYKDQERVQNLSSDDDADVSLYAQWNPNPYYIEFNGNGIVSGKMIDEKCFYDMDSQLDKCEFTRENYHFTGWNTKANGDGKAYADGATINNLTTEKDAYVTLWAQWEHDCYTVAFNANGGKGTMKADEILTTETSPLSLSTFTRNGYKFTGWNTAKNGSGTAYSDGQYVTDLAGNGEKVTLYAQWKKLPDKKDPNNDPKKHNGSDSDTNGRGHGTSTGDNFDISIWIIAAISAAATAIALPLRKRRSE